MAARLNRRSRPVRLASGLALLALAAVLALLTAGCAASTGVASPPPVASSTPPPDAALAATRSQLEAALRTAGFALIDEMTPYSPPATAALAAAPRGIYRAVLPNDPEHGTIAVFDLGTPAAAAGAAAAYATYLTSGPVLVEFPPDTRFVLRQLGSTLVFYAWSAASSPDDSGGRVADALETVGQGIVVR